LDRSATDGVSTGFQAVSRRDARLLILGSLPGKKSLEARRYYAQPQNAFWPIMGRLFGAGPDLAYDDRLRRLVAARIALWDVCRSAIRPGSLDQKIDLSSVEPNDFSGFFAAHPHIELIGFNGAAAEKLFRTKVAPILSICHSDIITVRLPSTSPAHAAQSLERKHSLWREALASFV
jgi:TDG/mug DNA glycosylase family protein